MRVINLDPTMVVTIVVLIIEDVPEMLLYVCLCLGL